MTMAMKTRKKRATFKLDAPRAREVYVAGTFNDWTTRPLKKQKNGQWSTFVNLAPGTYEYRFVIDGEWCEDPAAEEQRVNPFGGCNSVLKHD
jgi:1,4-alpha-glucan branching enzyme